MGDADGGSTPITSFNAEIRRLHEDAGKPSLRTLQERSEIIGAPLPKSTAGDLLSGAHLPTWAAVEAFLATIRALQEVTGGRLPAQRTDPEQWRALYVRVQ